MLATRNNPSLLVDRSAAGKRLTQSLIHYKRDDPIILAVLTSGVPIGFEIARAIRAPLDIIPASRICLPGSRDRSIACVVDGDFPETMVDPGAVGALGLSDAYVRQIAEGELARLRKRGRDVRGGRLPLPLKGRTVILTDDGVLSGLTMRTACHSIHRRSVKRLILAVPIANPHALDGLAGLVDDIVCLTTSNIDDVRQHYQDFETVSDREATSLLDRANQTESCLA